VQDIKEAFGKDTKILKKSQSEILEKKKFDKSNLKKTQWKPQQLSDQIEDKISGYENKVDV
jgi:hypothetical protein